MKIAYTPEEAAKQTAIGINFIKDSIRNRELPAHDAYGKPVILNEDLKEWVSRLPGWDR